MYILPFQEISWKGKLHSVPLQGASLFSFIIKIHCLQQISALKNIFVTGVFPARRTISANTFDINQLIIFLIL